MKIMLSHGRGNAEHRKEMFRPARVGESCGMTACRVNDTDRSYRLPCRKTALHSDFYRFVLS